MTTAEFAFLILACFVVAMFIVGVWYLVADYVAEARRCREVAEAQRVTDEERQITQRHFRVIGPDDRPAA